ncbi:MAG: hypothetical protein RI900_583 [Actinomycetota bacterium]
MTESRVRIPAAVQSLQPFVEAGVLGAAEVHFTAWLARAGGVTDPLVLLGAAVATWASQNGHSCASLPTLREVIERAGGATSGDPDDTPDQPVAAGSASPSSLLPWPESGPWLEALGAATGVVRVVQGPDLVPVLDQHPLVLCGSRLYLQRHWVDECVVAQSLRARVASTEPVAALSAEAVELLDALLPQVVDGEPDLQRQAADTVLANRVSLLVGGPGTGKTYSLARILAVLLCDAHSKGQPLRVALAAPTGKAAARMQESVAKALAEPEMLGPVPQSVHRAMQLVVPSTIHRLLGSLAPAQHHRFRHTAANPLPHDVVVIDETSMVSAPQMARLLEAVPADARLLLIGDPDQLESVERGAVLGDIVAAAAPPDGAAGSGPLAGVAVRLLRARRFKKGSPIALFADAVRTQQFDDAKKVVAPLPNLHDLRVLREQRMALPAGAEAPSLVFEVPSAPEPHSGAAHHAGAEQAVRDVAGDYLEAARERALVGDGPGSLAALSNVRILCAHRHGPFGVSHWNQLAEQWLFGPAGAPGQWYPGRPLLITRNDPRSGLSNGDTGVVVAREGGVAAVFSVGGSVLELDPVQLADVQTAFAMTVHKSQGSEYPTVVFILPPASSPLATRELVYTGATRAREHLVLVGDDASLQQALASRALRMTGLTDALR